MPFHLIFDRDMFARQAGASIARVIPQLRPVLPPEENQPEKRDSFNADVSTSDEDCDEAFEDEEQLRLTSIFELARPPIPFSFHNIMSQINQVFVLRTKLGKSASESVP